MKYIIVIENERKDQKREYEIKIEELRKKGNIADSLTIDNQKKMTVTRKIGYYQGETYILDEPKIIELPYKDIDLFEGINYIYLKDDSNTVITINYILKNVYGEYFSTKVEVSSLIKQTADNILLQVSKNYPTKDNLISEINLTPGEVKIKANKIGLEGYTTINGGFSVDEKGNASIANGAVKINNSGIQLQDGTSIVGGKGLLSNLTFKSYPLATGLGYGNGFGDYGWNGYVEDVFTYYKMDTYIDVNIPDKFEIESAYIYIRHLPMRIKMSNSSYVYGRAYNLKCYKANIDGTAYIDGNEDSETTMNFSGVSYGEISNCFNNSSNNYSPSSPSSSNLKVETVVTNNIKSSISKNCRIKLSTTNGSPSSKTASYQTSGYIMATLNVYGYMKI